MNKHVASTVEKLPFSFDRLDNLMEEAGLDVLIATSKHNVGYLLGGYKFIFFSAMDAIGHSRYLPVFVYVKDKVENTAYVGNRMEGQENENHPFWVPNFMPVAWGSVDSMQAALDHLRKAGIASARIGIEPSFLPVNSYREIAAVFGEAKIIDATGVLERLRAIKSPAELALLKEASELITESMQATIGASGAGDTKAEIIERLRREETNRGLQFEYCFLTLGASLNRASSQQAWAAGEVLSIDSGGNLGGYIGDICRMGILGEPDAELEDLLAEVETVQQAAFSRIAPGIKGGDMIAYGREALARQPNNDCTDFFAHGMGLISHEPPFLMTNHPVAYEGIDADHPLEPGMVISVETTMQHPRRGFIKLEDTVAVTDSDYELYGTEGRGWNRS